MAVPWVYLELLVSQEHVMRVIYMHADNVLTSLSPFCSFHEDRRHLLNRLVFLGLCITLSGEEGGVSSSFLIDSALSLPVLDWKLASEGLVNLGASSWTRRLVLERE